MKPRAFAFLAAAALAGCAGGGSERIVSKQLAALDWREIATDDDRNRLRQWRAAWVQGLGKAEAAGHRSDIVREGSWLQPDAAIAWQTPKPGTYQCRMVKIGAKGSGLLDYVAYPPFDCRLREEDGLMSFAKLTGSQRPIGLLFPDSSRRMVFLGTLQLGDERKALQHGQDRERDMAGLVERVGEGRWRIAFPYPHFESTVDVLELLPRD